MCLYKNINDLHKKEQSFSPFCVSRNPQELAEIDLPHVVIWYDR